ncbi:hypothetical protein LJR230_004821 [Trinickia sp. LjRoot230]|uniref:hypothetical protein n=1 Tax=Trinickia sp. LjRoot230 TaxID=3342288 RepID=UPI003ECFD18A
MSSLINGRYKDPFATPEPPSAQQGSPSAPADLSAPARPAQPSATVAGLPGPWAGSKSPQADEPRDRALLRQYFQPSIGSGGSSAALESIDGPRLSPAQRFDAERRLARALGDLDAVIKSLMSGFDRNGTTDVLYLRDYAERLKPQRLKREAAIEQALDAAPDVPAQDIAARLGYTDPHDVAFIEGMRNRDAAG